MGATQRGTGINLVNRFWTLDPLTQVGTLADPTVVTFIVDDPDGNTTTYVFGVDLNVTNPSVGIYVCQLAGPLPTGTWRYRCEGTGAVEATSEEFFDILASGVLTPVAPTVATPGPCSPWINGDDVAACGPDLVGDDHFLLDDWAYMASHLLYELSGRQFPGTCTRTVRPCTATCSCWGFAPSRGLGPWAFWSWGVTPAGLWYWGNECGDTCGCGSNSYVELGGYPVREILEVKIGGEVLPLTDPDTGLPNYRLDARRRLIRMGIPSGVTGGPTEGQWPACQALDLDDTQPGTFSVTYTWGADVPLLGRQAAAQLARELYIGCNGGECALPGRVTRIVRQGVEMDRIVPLADALRSGSTGILLVDSFIAALNPTRMQRRPAVYSPDIQTKARKVGQQ